MTRRPAAVVTLLLAVACGAPDDIRTLRIEPVASVEVPASLSPSLVLLEDGDVACVTETYMHRIVCTAPGGETLVFGGRGEGPGEFRFPGTVLRGSDGAVGVLDADLQRLSVFTETGGHARTISGFPPGFRTHERTMARGTLVGSYRLEPLGRASIEVELETGGVLWRRTFPLEKDVADCSADSAGDRRLGSGQPAGGRSLLFVACHGEFLVWYADRRAAEPTVVLRSTYIERYPTERDLASLLQTARIAAREEAARATLKAWYGPRVIDDRLRLWAVSRWEFVEDVVPLASHIDLFDLTTEGPRHALTVELRDKVIGIDVVGGTLAVLVERDDGGAVRERRVDWYDIAILDQRSSGGIGTQADSG